MSFSSRAIHLVSVNTHEVEGRYEIVHAGNSTTIDGVAPLLLATKPTPKVLVEQHDEIGKIGRQTIPGIQHVAIPTGLHLTEGPDGIMKFLHAKVETLGLPRSDTATK
ncbi:hypothetical protein MNV49_005205 [Pseudohyphozyma bogoriensis]|nr:hypothetical protein MNV49_005205 [Pseudohyphozyma bogoriensis]